MSIKPILFNTEMVRAILDGRKTQTRRVVKEFIGEQILSISAPDGIFIGRYGRDGWLGELPDRHDGNTYCVEAKPPCKAGDILWVRETWAWLSTMECASFCIGPCKHYKDEYGCFVYKADNPNFAWHPSIHMPKEAARIFLRVTDVRVERLQDINSAGAIAEGCDGRGYRPSSGTDGTLSIVPVDFSVERFQTVWDKTVPRNPCKFKRNPWYWKDNPYIWVIEFERCEKPDECL